MTRFEMAYEQFLQEHSGVISSKEEHGHAEHLFLQKVWFPAVGHFHNLYPEYKVHDFLEGRRFLDFAYLVGDVKICIEVDGYASHWRDINKSRFSDHLMRQNHLVLDGWKILRFSYDDVNEKPKRCQQIVQQALGLWSGGHRKQSECLTFEEHSILRYMDASSEPVAPKQIAEYLRKSSKTVRKMLSRLVDQGVIEPGSGELRIRSYRRKQ
ncbi:MarR family transcriptional regulator [Paenibacillus turpanensis]|uniref:MarR family transcriptional regulator n=1 Tax=Paenibacillus turpanensis TaxID=2689078 RepID=UPI00140C9048|nr:MarR family transcriptional regulator [Paenibacillus turpanensis]